MPLLAVIVIYKRVLAETETFCSLERALVAGGVAPAEFELLVYDNSPEPQQVPTREYGIRYQHDASNSGLVTAYNQGRLRAERLGSEWMLLLDQDSILPPDFLKQFASAAQGIAERTIAIVPKVRVAGRLMVPVRVVMGLPGIYRIRSTASGPQNREISTINSGAFVRLSFLRELGGYPERYSLDAVDLWFFARAYAAGKNVFVMPCWIDHSLSIADIPGIAAARWQSILRAQADYLVDVRGPVPRILGAAALAYRATRLLIFSRAPRHAAAAFSEAARLLSRALRRRGSA